MKKELEKEIYLENKYVVYESDREIDDAFEDVKEIQIFHFHAVKYVDYFL